MKIAIFLLLPTLILAANLDYMFSAGYVYDSNIGQNTNEVGKGYFVPGAYLKLKGEKTPLYVKVSSIYENYLTERSPILNSPFLSLSGGADFKKKQFSYGTELRAALYYGQSVQDSSESSSWATAKNSYRWYNDFGWKIKRHRIHLNSNVQINDYGASGKDALRLTIEPHYHYRFKVRKKDKVKLSKLSFIPEYEVNLAAQDQYSYNYFSVGAGGSVKLWRTSLNLSLSYATKKFTGKIEHPHNGEMIDVANNYFYTTGSYTIPLVADLDLKLHGKVRFKESDNPSYAWNRHTIGAKLVWKSTFGKYRNRSQSSHEEERDEREEI